MLRERCEELRIQAEQDRIIPSQAANPRGGDERLSQKITGMLNHALKPLDCMWVGRVLDWRIGSRRRQGEPAFFFKTKETRGGGMRHEIDAVAEGTGTIACWRGHELASNSPHVSAALVFDEALPEARAGIGHRDARRRNT